MKKYVITGNGPAGINAAKKIRSIDKEGSISVFAEEAYPLYYKPRLPEVLSGEVTLDEIIIYKPEWYESNNIQVKYRTTVNGIDILNKTIATSDKQNVPYDKLLLASGGYAFLPPVEGIDKKGVFTFRSPADVENLIQNVKNKNAATIVGGGLLALEVGYNLTKLGIKVNIIEIIDRLLPRQLDQEGAVILQKTLEDKGFVFYLKDQLEKVCGNNGVEKVILKSGKEINTGALIVCIGIRSKIDLAKKTGIEIEKAVVVDEYMRTSADDIWAAGDVAEYNRMVWGLWAVAMRQGNVAGANMAGENLIYYPQSNTITLKVTGIDLISSGIIDDDKYEKIVFKKDKIYRKILIDKGKIVGCILLGDITNDKKILKCMSDGDNIENYKNEIINPKNRLDCATHSIFHKNCILL